MKKLIIFMLPILVLLFGNVSFAYSQADLTKLNTVFHQKYNRDLSYSVATQILNKWETVKSTYPYGYIMTNNSTDLYSVFSSSAISLNSTSVNVNGPLLSNWFYSDSTNRTLTWSNAAATFNGNVSLSLGTWNEFHVVPIEWENPLYNPNMPIPEFTTNYGEISVNSSSPEIPFDIEFVNPSADYFIEIFVNYWIPDNMSISINRTIQNNDGYVYKALSRDLVSDYLIEPTQMLKISGINNFNLQLKTSWEDVLDEVPASAIEYANPNNLPSGMFTRYKSTYEDYCRKILGFYGSQFTIMMRYFTIVNNTQYVIGAWRTWTSYSPNEFTERIPDYYVPYVPASGQENITNDIDPETISVVSGSGTNTGVVADPNYYITVNQNTPNYPDYPTIASYNKDNLLLDTINQMNSLSTFFGQFGEFLTLSFSFFPAWIWAIIGVGFSISIVVMFLKIL